MTVSEGPKETVRLGVDPGRSSVIFIRGDLSARLGEVVASSPAEGVKMGCDDRRVAGGCFGDSRSFERWQADAKANGID